MWLLVRVEMTITFQKSKTNRQQRNSLMIQII